MSDVDVNLMRDRGRYGVGEPSTRGLEREVEGDVPRVGVPGIARNSNRLFSYDRNRGLQNATLSYAVTKSDRMSFEEARDKLDKLHASYGLHNLMEEQYYVFDIAMFLCYAINGVSTLIPAERVKFVAGGSEYDYKTFMDVLGVDGRRFCRAFASVIVSACRSLYYHYDVDDPDQVYARDLMIQLADERNIHRAPWLIADCAESDVTLSPTERALVAVSKRTVIANSANAVDRRRIGAPVRSLDNYDSSVMQSIPNDVDIHAAEPVYHS